MNAHSYNKMLPAGASMADYVASVLAEVVTPATPEAIEYMADHCAPFEDFLADETFTDPTLGKPFLFRDGEQVNGEWVNPDAAFVTWEG